MRFIQLLIPALIPSWRFFDRVAPSPRIEYKCDENEWRECRPRPGHMPFSAMLARLFYNPRWNDTLYLNSCAERLMNAPTSHSIVDIESRLCADLGVDKAPPFRLVFVFREGDVITRDITFVSPAGEPDAV